MMKFLNLGVWWLQIRRVRCGECPTTFAYVARELSVATACGIRVVTSDAMMRERLAREVERTGRSLARKPRMGIARCARCHRAQRWMVRRAWLVATAWALGVCVSLSIVLFLAARPRWRRSLPGWFWPAEAALWTSAAGVSWVAVRRRLGKAGEQDPRAMKDEELRSFLGDCERRRVDPVLAWSERAFPRRGLARHVQKSLGFVDLAGGFDIPVRACPSAVSPDA
jgi:hypothetical protein